MTDLRQHIRKHRLTQVQAAKMLGVGQSRVSELVNGKYDKFSLDMLVTMAARLGLKPTLKLTGTGPRRLAA